MTSETHSTNTVTYGYLPGTDLIATVSNHLSLCPIGPTDRAL
ncbi:MAG: hypothetical protein U1E27_02270 [Kiritimatiellia bacterium]|nr:hypothetical protein [Kiritimatiellia bacterium]